jgi:hypothetical protein
MPAEIVPPMFKMLSEEIEWAIKEVGIIFGVLLVAKLICFMLPSTESVDTLQVLLDDLENIPTSTE